MHGEINLKRSKAHARMTVNTPYCHSTLRRKKIIPLLVIYREANKNLRGPLGEEDRIATLNPCSHSRTCQSVHHVSQPGRQPRRNRTRGKPRALRIQSVQTGGPTHLAAASCIHSPVAFWARTLLAGPVNPLMTPGLAGPCSEAGVDAPETTTRARRGDEGPSGVLVLLGAGGAPCAVV